jgi:Predicted acetyltransferase
MKTEPERKEDLKEIYDFIKTAFETAQVKSGTEQDYTDGLRKSANYIPQLALAAKENGKIIGYIMLTKIPVSTPEGPFGALLVAPLCVDIAFRNKGIGQELMREAFKKAKELGYKAVFLVGNPEYYSRAGFKETTLWDITNADNIPAKFVLGKELEENALANVKGFIKFL